MSGVPDPGSSARAYWRWLAVTALAYSVVHHLGLLPGGLGEVGDTSTRWADWLDLLVPWAVLVPAALTLRAARAEPRAWILLAVGAVAYAEGHGIHLAANSVANVRPGEPAHLWDEVVGHLVWYAGVALVATALASTMKGRRRPLPVVGQALALGVGITWATNTAGGVGTAGPGLVLALAAAAFGWGHRAGLGVVLLWAAVPAVGVLALLLAGVLPADP